MARCTCKCSVAGAASSDVTVHCSSRGTQHHGSWPLHGATTFLRLLYEPFLTRFILSFFSPPPSPSPPRLLFPFFLLCTAGEEQRRETRCAHAMWIVRKRGEEKFWEEIAWDFVGEWFQVILDEIHLGSVEKRFLNVEDWSNISFFSFKVLVNFGKFAGKEYKVSIIENEGNEESLNMEFVFSKNNNLSSKKMEFFNNILNANSPTPSKTNQWFDELKFSSTKLSLHTIKNVCNYITKKKRRKTASNRINSRWNLRNWRRRRREAKTNQNQEKKRNKIISTGYYACYFLSLSLC